MKIKYTILLTCIVCVVAVAIGLYNKSNYQDFNTQEEPFMNFEVGLISETVVAAQIERMRETLDETPIIIAAKCETKSHFLFSCTYQTVTVEKIFKGDDICVGDSIKISKSGSVFFMDGYGNGYHSINTGFVNEMTPGMTYLIFIQNKLNNADLFMVDNNLLIKPIFCYENIDNTTVQSQSDDASYTAYKNVQDNEYFFDSESAYQLMYDYKSELLVQYPLD